MSGYGVIADQDGFRDAVNRLAAGSGPVAVDVERASGFRYTQRAYLVQVARTGSGLFLFDPPAIGDFSPLQAAIGDAEWILHAASQDLPSLRELGLVPATIFDTELAARLLGWPKVGLGAVVEATVGIALAKEHSASDWSTRPLPEAWLDYAAADVEHLVAVREVLAAELAAQEKTEVAAEEFDEVLHRAPKPPRTDPWRRLSGLHTLRGRRAFAIAREMWQAREDFAREQDTAPGRLLPDRSIVAAIKANPESKPALAGLKEFNGRASRSQLERWWTAMTAGRKSEDLPLERLPGGDALPPPRAWPDRNPEAAARLKQARPAVAQRAEDLSMPTENLLTPDTLRRVCWEPPSPITAASIGEALRTLGARPWQIERTAQVIAEAFVESMQTTAEDSSPHS